MRSAGRQTRPVCSTTPFPENAAYCTATDSRSVGEWEQQWGRGAGKDDQEETLGVMSSFLLWPGQWFHRCKHVKLTCRTLETRALRYTPTLSQWPVTVTWRPGVSGHGNR